MFTIRTILLLLASNIFMTFAWYGHLKVKNFPLWQLILLSWGIAFFEYCLLIPANRIGYLKAGLTGFQLKIIQECITLMVFIAFAYFVLKEKMEWKYLVSFSFLVGAVYFAFKK